MSNLASVFGCMVWLFIWQCRRVQRPGSTGVGGAAAGEEVRRPSDRCSTAAPAPAPAPAPPPPPRRPRAETWAGCGRIGRNWTRRLGSRRLSGWGGGAGLTGNGQRAGGQSTEKWPGRVGSYPHLWAEATVWIAVFWLKSTAYL